MKAAITRNDDPLFVAHERETLPGEDKTKTFWHPFVGACRKIRVSHWRELPNRASFMAALKPKQRRRRTRRKPSV